MTQRIECLKFPEWDGARLTPDCDSPVYLTVRSARATHETNGWRHPAGTQGIVRMDECRGLVGVEEGATGCLFAWSPVLRRWILCAEGVIEDLRREARYSRTAVWLKPGRA